MKKNYKFQIPNKAAPFGQVLNAFGERDAHELHELTRIAERNYNGKITTKGSHGLHKDSFKLQTMTALIKSFCGCFTGPGGRFSRKESPWPPEAAGCCTLFTVVGFSKVQISYQT